MGVLLSNNVSAEAVDVFDEGVSGVHVGDGDLVGEGADEQEGEEDDN